MAAPIRDKNSVSSTATPMTAGGKSGFVAGKNVSKLSPAGDTPLAKQAQEVGGVVGQNLPQSSPQPSHHSQRYESLQDLLKGYDEIVEDEKQLEKDVLLYSNKALLDSEKSAIEKKLQILQDKKKSYDSIANKCKSICLIGSFINYLKGRVEKEITKLSARKTQLAQSKEKREQSIVDRKVSLFKIFADWKTPVKASDVGGKALAHHPLKSSQEKDEGAVFLSLLRSWLLWKKKELPQSQPSEKTEMLRAFFDNFQLIDSPKTKEVKEYNALLKTAAQSLELPTDCQDVDLILKFGSMYERGSIVDQDNTKANEYYKKAFEWYSKAAELGSSDALYHLGCMYMEGKGVTQNIDLAHIHFQSAANNNHAQAALQVGWMAEKGIGEPIDLGTANYYYKKIANINDAAAMYMLAMMMLTGDSKIRWSDNDCILLLQRAAVRSYVPAMIQLGNLYTKSMMGPNFDTGISWYQQASEKGAAEASIQLGKCYMNTGNKESALIYFQMGEEQASTGEKKYQLYLQAAKDTNCDYDTRKYLYEKAAEFANDEATRNTCLQEVSNLVPSDTPEVHLERIYPKKNTNQQ
jgi:TPR repeat protein